MAGFYTNLTGGQFVPHMRAEFLNSRRGQSAIPTAPIMSGRKAPMPIGFLPTEVTEAPMQEDASGQITAPFLGRAQ